MYVKAFKLPGAHQRTEAIILLCLNLPEAHLHTLKYVMSLLHDVVHTKDSKMTAFNLAAIFSPNILRPDTDDAATSEIELENHAPSVGVVEFLIENFSIIGTIPPRVERHAMLVEEHVARTHYRSAILGKRSAWW